VTKLYCLIVLCMLRLGGESETSTAPTKRRRKSECPSRPQKRTVNKNLTRPSDLPDVSFTSPVSLPYEKGEVMGSASPKVLPVNPSNSTIPSHPISPHHADAQATQSSTMQSSFSSSRLSTSVPRTSVVSVNCQSCVDPVELTTLWTTFPVGSGATAPASFGRMKTDCRFEKDLKKALTKDRLHFLIKYFSRGRIAFSSLINSNVPFD
jgi:hypothetical protein